MFSTETQHKTDLRQKSKQQTTNKYFICNVIDTKAKTRDPEIQTTKHDEHVTVQIESSNDRTKKE